MYERISLFAARVLGLRLSDLKRDEGQGVTEYGLALAFVIIVLAAVLLLLGGSISEFISKVGADLTGLPASL
jgi:Flp pilus assembly pilin Flp